MDSDNYGAPALRLALFGMAIIGLSSNSGTGWSAWIGAGALVLAAALLARRLRFSLSAALARTVLLHLSAAAAALAAVWIAAYLINNGGVLLALPARLLFLGALTLGFGAAGRLAYIALKPAFTAAFGSLGAASARQLENLQVAVRLYVERDAGR